MNNIDWKQKFSSRKFWTAVLAYLTSLLTAFNVAENNVAQIVLIVSGIAALAVYMLAESIVDHGRARGPEYEYIEVETADDEIK